MSSFAPVSVVIADAASGSAGAGLMLNALTFLLAVGTFWMAFATHKMARHSKATLDLESKPYLVLKEMRFNAFVEKDSADATLQTRAHVGLTFINSGRAELEYRLDEFSVTVGSLTNPAPTFHVTAGTVAPQESTTFWFDEIVIQGELTFPVLGMVQFGLTYSPTGATKTVTLRRRFQFTALAPGAGITWTYLKWPV